jgi:hypothetical protein
MSNVNAADAAIRDALAKSIFDLVKQHEAELVPAHQVTVVESTNLSRIITIRTRPSLSFSLTLKQFV